MEFEELHPATATPPPASVINPPKDEFEPMQFAGSSITLPDGCYRVFTSPTEFVEVQAGSAYEAMQKTDIRSPHRIERYSLNRMKVLTQQVLAENAESEAKLAQEAAEAEGGVSKAAIETASEGEPAEEMDAPVEAAPTEEKAAEEGLDDSEVDALLNADSAE